MRPLDCKDVFGQYLKIMSTKLTREKSNRLNHLVLVVGDVSRQAAGQEDANELIKREKNRY